MKTARAAAIITWGYAAAFGLPTIPVALYLAQRGLLPTFLDLFPMYGGPWSESVNDPTLITLLVGYLLVTALAAWSAVQVHQGSRRGAVVNLALVPIEAIFWIGFALPLPWLIGAARLFLLALSWSDLSSPEAPA